MNACRLMVDRIRERFPYLTIDASSNLIRISHERKHWYSDNPSWPRFTIIIESETKVRVQRFPFVVIPLIFFLLSSLTVMAGNNASIAVALAICLLPTAHFAYRYHQICAAIANKKTIGERLGYWLGTILEG
jgi:hypothetical protein